MGKECPCCRAWESKTIDRLLAVGYGPRFVSERWGIKRHHVANHRDKCLVGARRAEAEADLMRMVAGGWG